MYLLAKEFHGANSYVKERFNVGLNVASDIRFDYFLSEEKERRQVCGIILGK